MGLTKPVGAFIRLLEEPQKHFFGNMPLVLLVPDVVHSNAPPAVVCKDRAFIEGIKLINEHDEIGEFALFAVKLALAAVSVWFAPQFYGPLPGVARERLGFCV